MESAGLNICAKKQEVPGFLFELLSDLVPVVAVKMLCICYNTFISSLSSLS